MAHLTSSSGSSSSISSKNKDEENSPLWKYVTRMEKMGEGGGSWKWTCNFCGLQKFGTCTRVRVMIGNLGNGRHVMVHMLLCFKR